MKPLVWLAYCLSLVRAARYGVMLVERGGRERKKEKGETEDRVKAVFRLQKREAKEGKQKKGSKRREGNKEKTERNKQHTCTYVQGSRGIVLGIRYSSKLSSFG